MCYYGLKILSKWRSVKSALKKFGNNKRKDKWWNKHEEGPQYQWKTTTTAAALHMTVHVKCIYSPYWVGAFQRSMLLMLIGIDINLINKFAIFPKKKWKKMKRSEIKKRESKGKKDSRKKQQYFSSHTG